MPHMRLFHAIPETRPDTPALDLIQAPQDLRELDWTKLRQVADDMRAYLLHSVGLSGGHFGAGLGVVELTVALHYCFDTPSISWFGMSGIRRTRTRY